MPPWIEAFFLAFIPLFVAIDPVGLVPIYLSMAANVSSVERNAVVGQAVSTAFLIGLGFLFLGQLLFQALGITVADFQIAGGLILLALAGQDLLASDQRNRLVTRDFGVVPLGMPLIAGPGMLTSVLALSKSVGTGITLAAMTVNLLIVLLALRFADTLAARIGATTMRAISRLVALLLAAIAINLIRRGWQGSV